MSFYVVFVWYTHWYACWKCKREWLLCWLMEFSTTILFWISNYLPASKAQWLKLKSCIWSAISMCVSLLKIMPGNKGCAACQRRNTGNNLTSKRAAPAVCSRLGELGWRITAAKTKQRESCRPLALLIYQISNLTCSFTESLPKKQTKKNKKPDVGFKALWRDIFGSYGHHAEIPDMIPKMASLGKSFVGLPSPFPLKSISDHLQYQKHSASKLQ